MEDVLKQKRTEQNRTEEGTREESRGQERKGGKAYLTCHSADYVNPDFTYHVLMLNTPCRNYLNGEWYGFIFSDFKV